MRWQIAAVTALFGFLSLSAPAAAITITGTYLPLSSGPDNVPANGGGNIGAVFEAAAHQWELAILDDVAVTIDFFWEPIPDALAFSFGDTVSGSIAVTTLADWFVDATPETSEEYLTQAISHASLGGTTLTYGLGFSGGLDAANGHDLFTVLLHEIGHILSAGPNIGNECSDGDVDVAAPLPFAGVAIPTFNCFHVGLPSGYTGFNPLMFPFVSTGERSFISDADLLYVAQNGGWTNVDTSDATAIPEPASVMLVGFGGLGWVLRRVKSSRAV
jgi:hypothetical protein